MDPHDSNPVIAGLRDFYGSSPNAREFLTILASWEDRRITPVKRLQRKLARTGFSVDRSEVVQFLERMHSIGLGEYIGGEGVPRPRFVWAYPMTRLLPVASGEAWELEPMPVTLSDDDVEDASDGAEGASDGVEDSIGDLDGIRHANGSSIKHIFRLREDFSVKMRLPADLTANEAFRLADFIKTLPFSP